MVLQPKIRLFAASAVVAASGCAIGFCATPSTQSPPAPPPVVIDRVVAVVNSQAILASEVDEEIRLADLDAGQNGVARFTPARALEQLISRTLIQQQMRQEDVQNAAPTEDEVSARLSDLRRGQPGCAQSECDAERAWSAYLAARNLTPDGVRTYLRNRIEILRFIEQRFRQGIRVSPREVETYYRDTLIPSYATGAVVPPLAKVAPRIEQILLEQQVNALFDDWLTNLRRQGDIEILDPALEKPESQPGPGEGTP